MSRTKPSPPPGNKKYGNRYPWDDWFRKRRFTLKRGEDFGYTVDVMARMIRNKNIKNQRFGKLKITLDYDNQCLTVEVLRRN